MSAPLLTVREAAVRLGVSAYTVRGLVYARKLAVVRLSDGPKAQMRFRPEDLEAFIDARRRPAKGTRPTVELTERHPVTALPGASRYIS
jgi:excisionase family DNA binding protein